MIPCTFSRAYLSFFPVAIPHVVRTGSISGNISCDVGGAETSSAGSMIQSVARGNPDFWIKTFLSCAPVSIRNAVTLRKSPALKTPGLSVISSATQTSFIRASQTAKRSRFSNATPPVRNTAFEVFSKPATIHPDRLNRLLSPKLKLNMEEERNLEHIESCCKSHVSKNHDSRRFRCTVLCQPCST